MNTSIAPKNSSDFDILHVFKNIYNPYPYVKEIGELASENKLKVDYSWYVEDHLIDKLNKQIDMYLWKNIFTEGELVFIDRKLKNYIDNVFTQSDILFSLFQTRESRITNLNENLKIWARNLSRILMDYILKLYISNHSINSILKTPNHCDLVESSLKENLISNDLYFVQQRLLLISNYSTNFIGSKRIELIKELINIENLIERHRL